MADSKWPSAREYSPDLRTNLVSKGGEVTPLFYIGSTLGNALSTVLPPLGPSLLAAMGFVGVFAGAANTPIAQP